MSEAKVVYVIDEKRVKIASIFKPVSAKELQKAVDGIIPINILSSNEWA